MAPGNLNPVRVESICEIAESVFVLEFKRFFEFEADWGVGARDGKPAGFGPQGQVGAGRSEYRRGARVDRRHEEYADGFAAGVGEASTV